MDCVRSMRKRALCCSRANDSRRQMQSCVAVQERRQGFARPADAEQGIGQTLRIGQMVGTDRDSAECPRIWNRIRAKGALLRVGIQLIQIAMQGGKI